MTVKSLYTHVASAKQSFMLPRLWMAASLSQALESLEWSALTREVASCIESLKGYSYKAGFDRCGLFFAR